MPGANSKHRKEYDLPLIHQGVAHATLPIPLTALIKSWDNRPQLHQYNPSDIEVLYHRKTGGTDTLPKKSVSSDSASQVVTETVDKESTLPATDGKFLGNVAIHNCSEEIIAQSQTENNDATDAFKTTQSKTDTLSSPSTPMDVEKHFSSICINDSSRLSKFCQTECAASCLNQHTQTDLNNDLTDVVFVRQDHRDSSTQTDELAEQEEQFLNDKIKSGVDIGCGDFSIKEYNDLGNDTEKQLISQDAPTCNDLGHQKEDEKIANKTLVENREVSVTKDCDGSAATDGPSPKAVADFKNKMKGVMNEVKQKDKILRQMSKKIHWMKRKHQRDLSKMVSNEDHKALASKYAAQGSELASLEAGYQHLLQSRNTLLTILQNMEAAMGRLKTVIEKPINSLDVSEKNIKDVLSKADAVLSKYDTTPQRAAKLEQRISMLATVSASRQDSFVSDTCDNYMTDASANLSDA